jgi:hypothetical protein
MLSTCLLADARYRMLLSSPMWSFSSVLSYFIYLKVHLKVVQKVNRRSKSKRLPRKEESQLRAAKTRFPQTFPLEMLS